MGYTLIAAGLVIMTVAFWHASLALQPFHPCEVCGAEAADNYCAECGSEQLANTE